MIVSHLTRRLALVAASSLAVLAGEAGAQELLRDKPPPTQIRDLDYGDVLFHFYQDEYFDALVRLEVAREFGRIPHHEAEADLLAGGLYLSLGLHNEASRIFSKLLAGPVPQSVADRAFFYLARIGYQRGYLDQAWTSLERIRGPLPGQLEPERRLLASNVLMAQGRYAEAAAQLKGWTDPSDWTAYARFNLGVALVRTGDDAQGRPLLEAVGQMPGGTEEQLALRDRANLALGFAALQKHEPDVAVAALNRVRLDGPFTNRALLGLGWAEADAGRMDRALVPWLALRDRPVVDAAVQESYLAVPYAYAKIGSNGQAAEQYKKAVETYAAETRRIDESIAAIRKGGFLDSILEAVPRTDDIGWFWQLQKVPDAPHTRYLYELLASHEFQEGLKNYRDLRIMQASLQRWRGSLDAFNDMIATRERAAAEREPRRQELLASVDLDALERQQAELAARAATIQSAHDVGALATGEEAAAWQELERIEAELQAAPEGPQRDDLLDRERILRGTLIWKLDSEYKLRLRHLQIGVRDTADALAEARLRVDVAAQAAVDVPRSTAGFADRVAGLAARIDEITPRIDATAAAQEQLLANVAVAALEAQKHRLESYETQAHFALAALYDGAASGAPK
jgi:hypothetical protein